MEYTIQELEAVHSARLIRNGQVVFVGVGLPNLAVNLAKRLYAPDIHMVYEAGVIGADPSRLPLSIGDPTLVTGADGVVSMLEVFEFYLSGGLVDTAFLAGAQVDRFGNINTTVVGDWKTPKVRLPGSGGANAISSLARQVIVLSPHDPRHLVARVDFMTSPGNLEGGDSRARAGLRGHGPAVIITDKGILQADAAGEYVLTSIHPGVDVDTVRSLTGWDLRLSPELSVTSAPTEEELRVIREELDPQGMYTRKGAS